MKITKLELEKALHLACLKMAKSYIKTDIAIINCSVICGRNMDCRWPGCAEAYKAHFIKLATRRKK